MRFSWSLPGPGIALEAVDREIEKVLIDIDGPQLVLLRDRKSGGRLLGLSADHDDMAERWIHVPVSEMELEALCVGGVSMRNAMSKSPMEVVDVQGDVPKMSWSVSPSAIHAGIMPVRDANLPDDVGEELLSSLGKSVADKSRQMFRCGGAPVRGSSISFGAIGGIAMNLQGLWSAIARTLKLGGDMDHQLEASTLRMAAAVDGSFGIVVDSDSDGLQKIASVYNRLARVSADRPDEVVAQSDRDVIEAYVTYLKTLDDMNAEVFAQVGEKSVYIGPSYASQIRKPLRVAAKLGKPTKRRKASGDVVARGFFHAADRNKRTFQFFDTITNRELVGGIPARFISQMDRIGQEFHIGKRTLYNVTMRRVGGKVTLSALDPVQASLFASGPTGVREKKR